MGRGGFDDLLPDDARLHARHLPARIDLDTGHPLSLDQNGVIERAERAGVVPGPLSGHSQAVFAREQHGRPSVLDGFGERDCRRALIDRQVPGRSRPVIGAMLRDEQPLVRRRGDPRPAANPIDAGWLTEGRHFRSSS
jgi:hypothetical protein